MLSYSRNGFLRKEEHTNCYAGQYLGWNFQTNMQLLSRGYTDTQYPIHSFACNITNLWLQGMLKNGHVHFMLLQWMEIQLFQVSPFPPLCCSYKFDHPSKPVPCYVFITQMAQPHYCLGHFITDPAETESLWKEYQETTLSSVSLLKNFKISIIKISCNSLKIIAESLLTKQIIHLLYIVSTNDLKGL